MLTNPNPKAAFFDSDFMTEVTQEILNYGWTSLQLALLYKKLLPTAAKHNFISISTEGWLV